MGTVSRCISALCVLLVTTSSSLWGQRPQARQGFWIGFGFGYGSLGASCDGCVIDREGGTTFFLKMGGTPSPKLLIGGELNGWGKSESGTDIVAGNASAAVYFYPAPTSGLFLKGGLGFSVYSEEAGGIEATSEGVGLLAGVGYDIRLARNFSITPVANFFFGGGGDLELDGSTLAEGWTQNVVELALGFTFH